jgi:Fic family protein
MDMLLDMLNIHTITVTQEILSLIAKLDEFKGAWQSFGTIAPDRLLALRRIATIESIGSSTRIEGSKLSNQEVEALIGRLPIQEFSSRDEQEVAGYAEVMELVFHSWEHITLTENHIKQLHRDLLKFSAKDEWHRGNYKTTENRVAMFDATGKEIATIFQTTSAFDTPRLMKELVDWYQDERRYQNIHPLLAIAVFVVVFLEIHPFDDGNGRLSRILTTLLLLQTGYSYVPYSSLESIVEQNKQGYYLALRQTQGTIRTDAPEWQPWIMFFLYAMNSQVKRLQEKVDHEKLVLAAMPELSMKILDLAKKQGRLTVKGVVTVTGSSRNTVKAHLKRLIQAGVLKQNGAGRGVWYDLP